MRWVAACLVLSSAYWLGCRSQPGPAPAQPPNAEHAAAGAQTAKVPVELPKPPAMRLPLDPAPLRHRVTLSIAPGKDKFEGTVEIDLLLKSPHAHFFVNATEIEPLAASITQGGKTIPTTTFPGGDDFLGILPETPLPAGEATLSIKYRGGVRTKDDRGVFEERSGDDIYLFTQFENVEARSAFPCFDEPSFKAPWKMTFEIPEKELLFGNTPVVSEKSLGNGWKRVELAETKPLPAYLVAFAIGPFEVVDAGRAGAKQIPVQIVVPRGTTEGARYAKETTKEIVETLEKYFGFPYPYEKLDVVAVPYLVSFEAMENAGVITIRRESSLADKNSDTLDFQRYYFDVMAHEIAHQWFGNLVTMAWWDDVWLNEAFASWMEAEVINRARPQWNWQMIDMRYNAGAMRADSLLSTRKIRQPIESKHDIQNAFDYITYLKGRAVLDMFASWVGQDKFHAGLAKYFQRHAHKNATSEDFVRAIGEAAGFDVAPAFRSFLEQPGVPAVSVTLDCKGKVPKVLLGQSRHLPVGSTGKGDELWQVPICIRYDGGRACTLLSAKSDELVLKDAKRCPKWLMANEGAHGYYHVQLDAKALDALVKLPASTLALPERVSVMRDATAMVEGGKLPLEATFAQLPRLVKDPSPHMQRAALAVIDAVPEKLIPRELHPSFARFVKKTLAQTAKSYGWRSKPGEDEEVVILRPAILHVAAVRGEDPAVIAEGRKLARAWTDDPTALTDDLVDTAMEISSNNGDRAWFDLLRTKLEKETDPRRRTHLITGLRSFLDPELVKASLDYFLNGNIDVREGYALLIQDERIQEVVFAWVKQNYDTLVAKLPNEVKSRLPRTGAGFCDEERRQDVETFFKDRAKELLGGPRMLDQTLETVELCIALKNAQAESLRRFLSKQ